MQCTCRAMQRSHICYKRKFICHSIINIICSRQRNNRWWPWDILHQTWDWKRSKLEERKSKSWSKIMQELDQLWETSWSFLLSCQYFLQTRCFRTLSVSKLTLVYIPIKIFLKFFFTQFRIFLAFNFRSMEFTELAKPKKTNLKTLSISAVKAKHLSFIWDTFISFVPSIWKFCTYVKN